MSSVEALKLAVGGGMQRICKRTDSCRTLCLLEHGSKVANMSMFQLRNNQIIKFDVES